MSLTAPAVSATTAHSLAGKIALITGGTTGIGLATAKRYAEAGATVYVTGRNPDTLAAAEAELGETATVLASDASDPAAIEALFDRIRADHGTLHVLFLNAGIAKFGAIEDWDLASMERLYRINVHGPLLALKAALPLLADGASVVMNTSIVGQKGMPNNSVYGPSKAALTSIVKATAIELAPRGIRVNAISPGPIETPIYGKLGMPAEDVQDFGTTMQAKIPLQRFGTADEVAQLGLFLASDAASFITGTEVEVDGGFLIS